MEAQERGVDNIHVSRENRKWPLVLLLLIDNCVGNNKN